MADLDHFKIVNDTYGHDAGDRALRLFSEVVTATIRERDLIARWGGEEFAFALLDTAPSEAKVILDRVRLELAARLGNGDLRPFTVSFGLVAAASCETLDQAIRLADVALYEAKDQGRDRVVIADNPGAVETRPLEAHAAHRRSIIATLAQDDDPSDY